ncbi:MAG: T9SS type A sorting domain-containing protein [Bacteroidia bacterium]|nr:T9SS type A sorting domain-containing protein [Bacteroidia bacterium]HQV00228.1 T9SS type A sorting domain-containing protein [Bacteroidia bacterium]
MKKNLLILFTALFSSTNAFAQLPNNSFETWTAGLPNGWYSSLIPGYVLLEQSSDAHTGNYSAKLNVANLGGNPIPTSLLTGNGNSFAVPISYIPASVGFWYKASLNTGDQLVAAAYVYGGGGSIIGVGSVSLNSAGAYTQALLPITNIGGITTADSIALTFLITNPLGSTTIGSNANIDDVELLITPGINDVKSSYSLDINPNIVTDKLNITYTALTAGTSSIAIYNTAGILILEKNMQVNSGVNQLTLSLNDLASGTFVCTVKTKNLVTAKYFVLSR